MSQEAEIVDYLGDNKFVIFLEDKPFDGNPSSVGVSVAHDYVQFSGYCAFQMKPKPGGIYPYKPNSGASNWVRSRASIQIHIRDMIKIIMPYLNQHEYLQETHLKEREHAEDDKYYDQYGLTEPRYRKGDLYPPYAWVGAIIKYYDKHTDTQMVAFRRQGETKYERVSLSLFNELKDRLFLSLNKYELAKKLEKS